MAEPIPLVCRDHAGSGFLVAGETRTWLVTCVHLISGLKETPAVASFFAAAVIRVAGTPAIVPLFVDGHQRFSVVTNRATGHLVDAIAVRLTPGETAALISFRVYDRKAIARVKIGDAVTARGYPGLGQTLASGAEIASSEVAYQVDEITGLSIRLSAPSAGGLSGGPVSSDKGLVGIMHGDVGDSATMTNALVVSLDVVGGELLA